MVQNIHVLARGVLIIEEHVLLCYDPLPSPAHYYELNKSFYYLSGGHVEKNESARSSLVREIKEETGYTSKCEKFLGILEHAWNFKGDEICCHTHEINLIFKISIPELNNLIVIPQQEEHVAFKWIKLDQLNDVDFRPVSLKTLIFKWLKLDFNDALQSLIL